MSSQDGEKHEIVHLEGGTDLANVPSFGGSTQDADEEPELHCKFLPNVILAVFRLDMKLT